MRSLSYFFIVAEHVTVRESCRNYISGAPPFLEMRSPMWLHAQSRPADDAICHGAAGWKGTQEASALGGIASCCLACAGALLI